MNDTKFLEPKTIVALGLVLVGVVGWNYYMGLKYPQTPVAQRPADAKNVDPSVVKAIADKNISVANSKEKANSPLVDAAILNSPGIEIALQQYSFKITPLGMGLRGIILNNFSNRAGKKVFLGDDRTENPNNFAIFSAKLSNQTAPLYFNLEKKSEIEIVGTAQVGAMQIVRTFTLKPETYSIESTLKITNPTEDVLKGVEVSVSDKIVKAESSHFLFPSYDHQDFFLRHNGKDESQNYSMAKENINKEYKGAQLVSLGSQYFVLAVVDKSDIVPDSFVTANVAEQTAGATMKYVPASMKPEYEFRNTFYLGPKNVEALTAADPELVSVMNYGMFGFLAHPMLKLMKFFFSFVKNWGVAIILLTIVARLIVLPFNLMSFKSMKAMQKIQPQMKALKEKYKDDPMTLNKQTMALMKDSGGNPISGCLPMLLQIPIFFALYRVIASSIEIYQQPFMGWITDLSTHDRFFILPALMGVTMFVQQKITPTTVQDPMQAKIMMWMPVLFTFLMIYLPSGLTLYMFVSSLFAVIQQYFFTKAKTA